MPETTHVPEGNYPKPAPVHQVDLDGVADRLIATLPGHGRRSENLAREAGVSLIMMAMEGGDLLREHSTDGVIMVQVLRGHTTLTVGKETFGLRSGELVMLQPGVRHDLRAEEQSVVLLTIGGGAP